MTNAYPMQTISKYRCLPMTGMVKSEWWRKPLGTRICFENSLTFIRFSLALESWNLTLLSSSPFSPPFFIPAICINIQRSLNRLNEYTSVSRRNVAPWIPAVNFNRENMLVLFVRGSWRAHSQDNPAKRTNSFRSASSERRETTRHNARLWLEVGPLLSSPLVSFLPSFPLYPLQPNSRRAADSHRFTRVLFIPRRIRLRNLEKSTSNFVYRLISEN